MKAKICGLKCCPAMKRMGMKVDKHHHEVASCQHELGLIFNSLKTQAE